MPTDFSHNRDGVDISIPRRLYANEGEKKSEDQREKGLANIHRKKCSEDGTAHDCAQQDTAGPP